MSQELEEFDLGRGPDASGLDSFVYFSGDRERVIKVYDPTQISLETLRKYHRLTNDGAYRFRGRLFRGYVVEVNPIQSIGVICESDHQGSPYAISKYIGGLNALRLCFDQKDAAFAEDLWHDYLRRLGHLLAYELDNPLVNITPDNVKVLGKRLVVTDLCYAVYQLNGGKL